MCTGERKAEEKFLIDGVTVSCRYTHCLTRKGHWTEEGRCV